MGMLTVQDAAERLHVSPKAIYAALADGRLTRHEQYGRVLVDEKEVENYTPIAGDGRPSKRKNRPVTRKEVTA